MLGVRLVVGNKKADEHFAETFAVMPLIVKLELVIEDDPMTSENVTVAIESTATPVALLAGIVERTVGGVVSPPVVVVPLPLPPPPALQF